MCDQEDLLPGFSHPPMWKIHFHMSWANSHHYITLTNVSRSSWSSCLSRIGPFLFSTGVFVSTYVWYLLHVWSLIPRFRHSEALFPSRNDVHTTKRLLLYPTLIADKANSPGDEFDMRVDGQKLVYVVLWVITMDASFLLSWRILWNQHRSPSNELQGQIRN